MQRFLHHAAFAVDVDLVLDVDVDAVVGLMQPAAGELELKGRFRDACRVGWRSPTPKPTHLNPHTRTRTQEKDYVFAC